MRKKLFNSGKLKMVLSVFIFSVFLFAFAGVSSAYTVSGYVRTGGNPVVDCTVHLMDGNTDVGNCHTSANGYFAITTACATECRLIAVPDQIDASYIPTYYPNQPDGNRGYVIYPSDMPENATIEPITEGEAAIAGGISVNVTGNIHNVNISGVTAFVYEMSGERVLGFHKINFDGSFSFTATMNSNTVLMIANAGYKTQYLNFAQDRVSTTWNINVHMEAISGNGSVVTPSFVNKLSLNQNYPNPFNPTTNINFSVPNEGLVKVSVFDLSGRMVAGLVNEYKNAGSYSVTFNASALSSGIYYYSIETGSNRITKQMMLIK